MTRYNLKKLTLSIIGGGLAVLFVGVVIAVNLSLWNECRAHGHSWLYCHVVLSQTH